MDLSNFLTINQLYFKNQLNMGEIIFDVNYLERENFVFIKIILNIIK